MEGSLTGIRVLDLTRVLAGPLATQMLGDLGADVIKVENPVGGDDARGYGPHFARDSNGCDTRESGFYLSANRNKRSITCDFSAQRGRDRILALAATSDVFVENFMPGTLARYGLDYDAVRQANPAIIYASLTGFGQDSPYAARPGYDAIFQAQGGWMSVTGTPDGHWSKTGPSLVDVFSSQNLATAILAALYHRDAKGGNGQHIDIALYDCAIAALSHVAENYLVSGKPPQRLGNAGNGGAPSDVFNCADGQIYITSGRQQHFERLCDALDCREILEDARFATSLLRFDNREALTFKLEAAMQHWQKEKLVEVLTSQGVPAAPLNDLESVFSDPHVGARGMKVRIAHTLLDHVDVVGNPIHFSETPVTYRLSPPQLGEHDFDLGVEE